MTPTYSELVPGPIGIGKMSSNWLCYYVYMLSIYCIMNGVSFIGSLRRRLPFPYTTNPNYGC